MADGPEIQKANLRALRRGVTMRKSFQVVAGFRKFDRTTPVVLTGYFNPIDSYGVDRFASDAHDSGVDALIVVDLSPEENDELSCAARSAGIDLIRMATPTTDDRRLEQLLSGAQGFLYYVTLTGVTGVGTVDDRSVTEALAVIRARTDVPIAAGFGIRTAGQASALGRSADAVVIGSAIVQRIASHLDEQGLPGVGLVPDVLDFVARIAIGLRTE